MQEILFTPIEHFSHFWLREHKFLAVIRQRGMTYEYKSRYTKTEENESLIEKLDKC